jgi:hypothetical protein
VDRNTLLYSFNEIKSWLAKTLNKMWEEQRLPGLTPEGNQDEVSPIESLIGNYGNITRHSENMETEF